MPDTDIFLSKAAEEVLPMYGYRLDDIKLKHKLFRDKTYSSVPVGALYKNGYHTVIVAPATSNTVVKCALGISDTLPTNMFAQAGKLKIETIVFACDDAAIPLPALVTLAAESVLPYRDIDTLQVIL